MKHRTALNPDKPLARTAPCSWICGAYHYLKIHRGATVLRLLLGVWVIWGDPFGLSTASDKALADDISRIRAYVQPVAPAPITVVNIDYASIRALHAADGGYLDADDWPLTYEDHARVLKALVSPRNEAKPAAVFYDIFFERPRNTSGDMARLGETLKRSATFPASSTEQTLFPPIFLAGGGSYMPMSDDSYDKLGKPRLAATAWEGYGEYYPISAPLTKPNGGELSLPRTAPTAAYVLYRELCAAEGRNCAWLDKRKASPLAVQWEVLDLPGCSGSLAAAPSHAFNTLTRYLGFGAPVQAAKPECLPFHQVTLSEVMGPTPTKGLKPPHLGPDEPYVVLAGVTMTSLNDYHLTPVYEKIAGVYLHAAATENLYRMEDDYVREYDIRLYSTAFWLMLVLLADQFDAKSRASREQSTSGGRTFPGWLTYLFVIPAVILTVYGLFYGIFDIALEGWLFMIGLILLLLPKPQGRICDDTTPKKRSQHEGHHPHRFCFTIRHVLVDRRRRRSQDSHHRHDRRPRTDRDS